MKLGRSQPVYLSGFFSLKSSKKYSKELPVPESFLPQYYSGSNGQKVHRKLNSTVVGSLKQCEFSIIRINSRTGGLHSYSSNGLRVVLVESKYFFLSENQ